MGLSILFDTSFYLVDFKSHFNTFAILDDSFYTLHYLIPLAKYFNHSPILQIITLLTLCFTSIALVFQKWIKTALIICFILLTFLIDANPLIVQFHDNIRLMTLFWFILFEFFPNQRKLLLFGYLISFSLVYFQPMALRDPVPWLVEFDGINKTLTTSIKHTIFSSYILKLGILLKIAAPIAYIFEWIAPLLGIWLFGQKRKVALVTLVLFHVALNLSLNLMTFLPVMLANLVFLYPFVDNKFKLKIADFKHALTAIVLMVLITIPYRMTQTAIPTPLNHILTPLAQETQWEMYSEYLRDYKLHIVLEKDHIKTDYHLSALRDWRWATRFLFSDYYEAEEDIDLITRSLQAFCYRYMSDKITSQSYHYNVAHRNYEVNCKTDR
jgi:hypothetical protein